MKEVKKYLFYLVLGVTVSGLAGCAGMGRLVSKVKKVKKVEKIEPAIASNYLQLNKKGDGFIKNWQVLGPFSFADKSYRNDWGSQEAIDEVFVRNEAKLVAGKEGSELAGKKWKKYKVAYSYNANLIDLDSFYNGADYAVAYMAANIHCPEDVKGYKLRLGSDDYIKVWLNGKKVHTYKEERRAAFPDQDTIENISLDTGWNTLTIKCVDVVFGWGVYCKIVDDKGNPVHVKSAE